MQSIHTTYKKVQFSLKRLLTQENILNTKRLLSRMFGILLAIAMLLPSLTLSSHAAEHESLASELFDLDTHSAYILGDSGMVYPDNSITRAEICSIFYHLLTESALARWESTENDFMDVDENSWYSTMVSTLSNIGLVVGYPDNTFQPQGNLTRAEFATLLCRLYGEASGECDVCFSDISGHWAEEDILFVASQGLFLGYPDGTFRPDAEITRAEVITVVNRFLGRSGQELSHFQRGMTTFYDNLNTSAWYYCEIQEAATSHDYSIGEDGAEYWAPLGNAAEAENPYPYVSVVHAGGTVDGITGTNSLEALNLSYILNMQYIELDFSWTSDGYLACIHDWSQEYSSSITTGVPMTLDEFKQIRIRNNYTPMTLDLLIEWLDTHPGVRIITDVKTDNVAALTQLAEAYPEMMDRFIPQIYQYDEYDAVAALGYQDIILTLYQLPFSDKINAATNATFAQEHSLWSITFAYDLLNWMPSSYIETLKTAGTQLLIHTVNDEDLISYYLAMGVDGVYRDY